jgi:two-component system sensor histidine kinase SaeS
MRPSVKWLGLTFIIFGALLGLVEGIAAVLLKPERGDLLALAVFLFIFGGTTLGLSIAVARSGLPSWVRSIRTQLMLISVIVAVLVVVNIGFVSYLMFISTHDLGLLLGLIIFSLGLSVMASLYLSQPTTRNLNEVINAVRHINAGNLQANVPTASRDEVGELATAFNAMVHRLQESLERERGLERTRRELIEAVSHDLRTPLSSIRAMIESINDGVVTDDATVKRYLRTAQSEIENLSQLVNDLFEFSQIDAGLLQLHTDSVFLQQLIPDTVETMVAQAVSQRLSLSEEVEKELPPITADSRRIQRVLYNLIQNAIRHTPADGSINVRATDTGDAVEVQVSDTGEGIPADDLSKVFERSYRSERSRSRQSGGAGLGLSIAKGIVEAHGGRIWANSEPGKGSVFVFTLPKVTANKT